LSGRTETGVATGEGAGSGAGAPPHEAAVATSAIDPSRESCPPNVR
jgi:hypothetical protein